MLTLHARIRVRLSFGRSDKSALCFRSVTDPRNHKRVALKKMPNVFQNLASCKRVFREIRMLASFKHDNVLGLLDILQPTNQHFFQEM